MVKLNVISPLRQSIEPESTLTKSTLQWLFLCSIMGNAVFARKEDKSESKILSSPVYRFNHEIDSGFVGESNHHRNQAAHLNHHRNPESEGMTWNGMKGVYGYRNSDTFRIFDYLGRNYGLTEHEKAKLEPKTSSSKSADVILIRSKDNEANGPTNSKSPMKNLLENHRMEEIEQKPERLTQIEEDGDVEDETTTETTTTVPSTSSASPKTLTSPATVPISTTTVSPITMSTNPTTATMRSPVEPRITTRALTPSQQQSAREVEDRPMIMDPKIKSVSMMGSIGSSTIEEMKQLQNKKNLNSRLSVHQLISESMPTLQMSVSPVYFYNKASKSLVAVPYLVMKSISKMPLLPNMMDSVGSMTTNGGASGPSPSLVNYVHSPLNQKLRSRSVNHLSPLLAPSTSDHRDNSYHKITVDSNSHEETELQSSGSWLNINR